MRAFAVGENPADLGAFVLPVAVAFGPEGRLAVADAGRRAVHLFVPEKPSNPKSDRSAPGEDAFLPGRYSTLTGDPASPLVSPVGLAFTEDGRLYVSDSAGQVVAFDAAGELLWTHRSVGETAWQRPTGLAWSPSTQRLFVVDTLAHRVFALHPDGTPAFDFGGRGEGPDAFNFPTHLARGEASGAPALWVTDTLNFRIRWLDEQGHALGAFGHHGDGSGDLAMPKGVAIDRDGIVYVVDSLFDNVQLFDREGNFLLTLGRRGTAPGEFWLPSGIAVSPAGELYVADTYNRRVQVFRIQEGYVPSSR